MRIALFTETYLPYINGVVTHVKVLKDGLEKMGHKVMVVTADPTARKHYMVRGVLRCPCYDSRRFQAGVASPISGTRMKYIKGFNPDIIHVHQEFGVSLSGIQAAKKLDIPLVWTMHTMYDDYLYYIAPRPFIPMVRSASHSYLRYYSKRADAITGPSKKVEQYLHDLGMDVNVNIVPNPVELDTFDVSKVSNEERELVRKKLGIGDDKKVVCFVGRLGKEKNVETMLNYWKECITEQDNLHLLIAGYGPVFDELVEQSEDLGIQSMVTFAGKVLHEELPPYYAISDMYLTTSLSDTNSISMLEGMASGLPVIHIHDELNKGQVVHGVNGFIFDSAEQMAQSLKKVRDMPLDELCDMKANVLRIVRKASDIALATRLLDVYEQAKTNKFERDENKYLGYSSKKIKKYDPKKKQ